MTRLKALPKVRLGLALMVAGVIAAVVILVLSFVVYFHNQHQARVATAQSSVSNCLQIEDVKTELRATLNLSLQKTPKIGYYATHPAELAAAQALTRKAILLFAPKDCYKLAIAVAVGLKAPPGAQNLK